MPASGKRMRLCADSAKAEYEGAGCTLCAKEVYLRQAQEQLGNMRMKIGALFSQANLLGPYLCTPE